jgi:hypothetical protein
LREGIVQPGDRIVVIFGTTRESGMTNVMHIPHAVIWGSEADPRSLQRSCRGPPPPPLAALALRAGPQPRLPLPAGRPPVPAAELQGTSPRLRVAALAGPPLAPARGWPQPRRWLSQLIAGTVTLLGREADPRPCSELQGTSPAPLASLALPRGPPPCFPGRPPSRSGCGSPPRSLLAPAARRPQPACLSTREGCPDCWGFGDPPRPPPARPARCARQAVSRPCGASLAWP